MPPYYLIHQAGKVASQTLEQAVRVLAPESPVGRHHLLSDRGLAYLEVMCRLPDATPQQSASIAHQLRLGQQARAEIAAYDAGDIRVLTGFRDPLRVAISAFFQNLKDYCPFLTYDPSRIDGEAEQLVAVFTLEFERMISGRVPTRFAEALLNLKMQGLELWFEQEFNQLFGIDIYSVRIADAPFVLFSSGKFKFCVYRTETLAAAESQLLQAIGLPAVRGVPDQNVGAAKEYAALYRAFLEKFRPPQQMLAYYYGGKFYRHFYGKAAGGVRAA